MLTMSSEMRHPLLRATKVRAGTANDGPGRSKPQDSRFDFDAEGHNLDLRLSAFPTIFGDVVTIRLLGRSSHNIYGGALSGTKMRTMLVDELEKAARGLTTLEEVLRVMDESEMDDLAW